MKNIGTLLMLLMFALTACTNEEEFSLPQPGGNESGTLTCRMMFYGDVTGYGGATRAGGHEWKEGDKLYIRFLGGSSTVTGCAEYSATGNWTLNYSGTFAEGTDQKCEVYYFENATHKSNTQVELTAHSAVYECTAGSYNYNGEEMSISAQLSPKTGRVRFVSDSERTFRLSGISYYTSFNLGSKSFASSSSALKLSTAQQGAEYSTGYVYGFYSDEYTREIKLMTDDYYVCAFPLSMLQAGKSGYITAPTTENNEGWGVTPFTGTLNGHDWVDLGLPSGLKWATCNVGASSPKDYGNYYAWGETTTKSSYTEDNSTTFCKDMSDIGGNATYDVARKQWGSTWRLPTKAEFDELLDEDNCTWTWTTFDGVNGYRVTGANGNSIFLPAAGYRGGTWLFNDGSYGEYWSSTPHESNTNYAYDLYFRSGYHYTSSSSREYGQSVRPVCE
ncbi:MAG: DUF1566 domain-containing protein [Bacteroidaceae bacterium]|nr:DUF1566 domain-containing protein [Bacteroidaceae bacterium]